jgi:hypothetical protein
MTTRIKGVALGFTRHNNVIEVQPMSKADALDLLQRKLSTIPEHRDMAQLVQVLEFMPLTIVQAARYITHNPSRYSVSQYLGKIIKSDRDVIRLLDHEASLLHRDWEANNSILLIW